MQNCRLKGFACIDLPCFAVEGQSLDCKVIVSTFSGPFASLVVFSSNARMRLSCINWFRDPRHYSVSCTKSVFNPPPPPPHTHTHFSLSLPPPPPPPSVLSRREYVMGMPIIKKGRKKYVCLPFNNTFCLLIASLPNSLSVELVHETWSYSIVRLLCIIKCALKNHFPPCLCIVY